MYVPLMMEGNIVVDGVLASCYALIQHDVFHVVAAPIRWFPEMTNWIFGENNRFAGYTDVLIDLARLLPYGQIIGETAN